MDIKVGELDHPQVIDLLSQHHNDMLQHSPVESVHALNLHELKASNIRFYSLWFDDELAGCGALKILDNTHGEVKSMRTSTAHLRKGVAQQLLAHIISQSQHLGLKTLSLETGTQRVFIPAQQLYQQFGFENCAPFGDYQEDPYSRFMSKNL
ncbi:GNAT family N-acetyltransferase [Thalassotalea sp. PLHSN55]|uniref:GNAT family N-acetyltransferase n=1 Tax=Thalassotalea sp. PLHSN55 TaxID=3435888 RepID=UPI003F826D45